MIRLAMAPMYLAVASLLSCGAAKQTASVGQDIESDVPRIKRMTFVNNGGFTDDLTTRLKRVGFEPSLNCVQKVKYTRNNGSEMIAIAVHGQPCKEALLPNPLAVLPLNDYGYAVSLHWLDISDDARTDYETARDIGEVWNRPSKSLGGIGLPLFRDAAQPFINDLCTGSYSSKCSIKIANGVLRSIVITPKAPSDAATNTDSSSTKQ